MEGHGDEDEEDEGGRVDEHGGGHEDVHVHVDEVGNMDNSEEEVALA